ncbi:MAG TPA: hypothetical protein VMU81_25145 [Acetobacteraceae bacterium]|nr:hypothetical protein [Acetobacteraceae bacterium]
MKVLTPISTGLHAAVLFARGRADALHYVETDMAGAARSFWAIPIGLPAIIALRLMTWVESGVSPHPGHELALDLMGYLVGWLGFAWLSFHLVPMLDCAPRWPRYIAAWNWCNVIENVLVVLGSIPGLLGAPPLLDEAAWTFAVGWALWIEWFATRESLGTNGLSAALLVLLDQIIGLLLATASLTLLQS